MTSTTPPPKAHILLLGGTGRTGRLVLRQALSRSHAVTVLVRDAASISIPTSTSTSTSNSTSDTAAAEGKLTLIEGSPLILADIEKALASIPADARIVVVSTLAQTRASGSPWANVTSPRGLMSRAVGNVLAVAAEGDGSRERRVEKVVVMSMFGAGESFGRLMFAMRWVMRWSNMSVTLEDHNAVDRLVKGSGVNFVLVRAAMLTDADADAEEGGSPVRELGDEGERAGWMPSVSRGSVARVLVDAVGEGMWDGRTPVFAN